MRVFASVGLNENDTPSEHARQIILRTKKHGHQRRIAGQDIPLQSGRGIDDVGQSRVGRQGKFRDEMSLMPTNDEVGRDVGRKIAMEEPLHEGVIPSPIS